jgi:hypothetical protein
MFIKGAVAFMPYIAMEGVRKTWTLACEHAWGHNHQWDK